MRESGHHAPCVAMSLTYGLVLGALRLLPPPALVLAVTGRGLQVGGGQFRAAPGRGVRGKKGERGWLRGYCGSGEDGRKGSGPWLSMKPQR